MGVRAHKIALTPTRLQEARLRQICDSVRFLRNKALRHCIDAYHERVGCVTYEVTAFGRGWRAKTRVDVRAWSTPKKRRVVEVDVGGVVSEVAVEDLVVGGRYVVVGWGDGDVSKKSKKKDRRWDLVVLRHSPPKEGALKGFPDLYSWMKDLVDRRAFGSSKLDVDLTDIVEGAEAQSRSEALKTVRVAYDNFFEGRARYPKFHREGESFKLHNQRFWFLDRLPLRQVLNRHSHRRVRLGNGCLASVKTMEDGRFVGRDRFDGIQSATVSLEHGRWFVSVCYLKAVEVKGSREVLPVEVDIVGVDLNLKAETAIALSTGDLRVSPRPNKKMSRRLRVLQRKAAKSVEMNGPKPSNRVKKIYNLVGRLQGRAARVRLDFIHKSTDVLTCGRYGAVVIEDLDVKAMQQGMRSVRIGIQDSGFGEFRRQLVYKGMSRGVKIYAVDRWFPSSKTCSSCGLVKVVLSLDERTFKCFGCGLEIDRDVNAAKNIAAQLARGEVVDLTAEALEEAKVQEGKREVREGRLRAGKKKQGKRGALARANLTK